MLSWLGRQDESMRGQLTGHAYSSAKEKREKKGARDSKRNELNPWSNMFGYLHYFTDPPKGFQCLWDERKRWKRQHTGGKKKEIGRLYNIVYGNIMNIEKTCIPLITQQLQICNLLYDWAKVGYCRCKYIAHTKHVGCFDKGLSPYCRGG